MTLALSSSKVPPSTDSTKAMHSSLLNGSKSMRRR